MWCSELRFLWFLYWKNRWWLVWRCWMKFWRRIWLGLHCRMGSNGKRWFQVWCHILCKFDRCRDFIFWFLFRFRIQLLWSLEWGCSLDLHLPWELRPPIPPPIRPSRIMIRRYQMGYWNLSWIGLIRKNFRSERLCEKFVDFMFLLVDWNYSITNVVHTFESGVTASLYQHHYHRLIKSALRRKRVFIFFI